MKIFGSKVLWRYILSYLLLISILLLSVALCFEALNSHMRAITAEGDQLALHRYQAAMDSQLEAMIKISDEMIMNSDVQTLINKTLPLSSSERYTIVQIGAAIKAACYRYDAQLVYDVFLYFPQVDSVITPNTHVNASLFFTGMYPLNGQADYRTCFLTEAGSGFFALKDSQCLHAADGRTMRVLYRALKKPSGELRCVIGFLVDADVLQTMTSGTGASEDSAIYLCLPDGSSLFSAEEDETLQQCAADVVVDSAVMDIRYRLVSHYSGLTAIMESARHALYLIMSLGLTGSLLAAILLAWANYRPISRLWRQVEAKGNGEEHLRNEIDDIDRYIDQIVQTTSLQSVRIRDMALVYTGKILDDFTNGRLTENEVNWAVLEENGVLLDKPCFLVLMTRIDLLGDPEGNGAAELCLAGSMVQQVFSSLGNCIMVRQTENTMQFLLNLDDHVLIHDVEQTAALLKEQIQQQRQMSITFALGTITARSEVWRSAQQAQQCLQESYLDHDPRVLCYADPAPNVPMMEDPFQTYEISLMNYLKCGNVTELAGLLDTMFDAKDRPMSVSQAQVLMLHVLEACLTAARQMQVSADQICPCNDAILTHVMQFGSIAQFKRFVLDACQRLKEENVVRQQRDESFKNTVTAFVEQHYDDINLNVTVLADQLNVSQSYLSTHFKRQSGVNASDYIHLVRIAKGKELMRDPALSLTQIARQIGYISDATFIRSFKKYEGITPGVYRKNFIRIESSIDKREGGFCHADHV